MPFTLGIKIYGNKIDDLQAKIIGLTLCGLEYAEVGKVLCLSYGHIKNKASAMYDYLGVTGMNQLKRQALFSGFDFYCHVNGQDLLSPAQRTNLYALFPALLKEPTKLILALKP